MQTYLITYLVSQCFTYFASKLQKKLSSHGHQLVSFVTSRNHLRRETRVERGCGNMIGSSNITTSICELPPSKSLPDFKLQITEFSRRRDSNEVDDGDRTAGDRTFRAGWGRGYVSIIILLFICKSNLIAILQDVRHLDGTMSRSSGKITSSKTFLHGGVANLGPAAIQTITETLSPILPFLGGDLLRGEDSDMSLWDFVIPDSMADTWLARWYDVRSTWVRSFISAKGNYSPSLSSSNNTTENTSSRGRSHKKYVGTSLQKRPVTTSKLHTVLSASTPFIQLSRIADMTLSDISHMFRYALYANRPGFYAESFRSALPEIKDIFDTIDDAISRSRGLGVLPAFTTEPIVHENELSDGRLWKPSLAGFGDIDAIQFCAALRIFAEWRIVRQVPDGYKGYAVGMALGQKDVLQNLAKIECAFYIYIEREQQSRQEVNAQEVDNGNEDAMDKLRSPTLRQLLKDEIKHNFHPHLPRLKGKSAAMGLLWILRQLQYQSETMKNIHSRECDSTYDTVIDAYKRIYNAYHGWAVQKVFMYSLQAAPAKEEIFKIMNPRYLKEVVDRAKHMRDEEGKKECPHGKTSSNEARSSTVNYAGKVAATCNNRVNQLERLGNHLQSGWAEFFSTVNSELEKVANHWVVAWNKQAANFAKLFRLGRSENRVATSQTTCVEQDGRPGITENIFEKYVSEEMSRKAYAEISLYLQSTKPIIDDLEGLFFELNMNDPTKV